MPALLFALAGCLAAGCAVTTIDVDVYKGPLVNEQEVQIQQTANLAFAAKPLLGRLRYELEKAEHDRPLQADDMPSGKRKRLQYSVDYVDPNEYEAAVKRVNDIAEQEHTAKRAAATQASDETAGVAGKAKKRETALWRSEGAHFVNRVFLLYRDAAVDGPIEKDVEAASRAATPPVQLRWLDPGGGGAATGPAQGKSVDPYTLYKQKLLKIERQAPPPTPTPVTPLTEDERQGLRARELLKARGSTVAGLETLNQLYVDALKQANEDPYDPDVVLARDRLFNALLQFAQRLSFMADNDALFAREVPGVPEVVGRGVRAVLGGENDREAAARSYVRVLQLVGNSIAVQINELQNQAKYGKNLQDSKRREVAGVRAALQRGPRQVLTDMEEAVFARLSDVRDRLREVGAEPGDAVDPGPADVQREVDAAAATVRDAQKDVPTSLKREIEDARDAADTARDAAALVVGDDRRPPLLPRAEIEPLLGPNASEKGGRKLLAELTDAVEAGAAAEEDWVAWTRLHALATYLKKADLRDGAERAVPKNSKEPVVALGEFLNDRADELDQAVAALEGQFDSLKTEEGLWREHLTYTLTLRGIRDIRAAAAATAGADDPVPGPVARDRLLALVRSELDGERSRAGGARADRVARLEAAEAFAAEWEPPTAPLHVEGEADAEGVMDAVIAALRHEHIQAVRRAGEGSEEAKRFAEAIDAAYEQRAGMQYIRPASAFLRTSYPASTLQRDARLGWNNTLAEHAGRQVPGADLFSNGPDLRTVLELDKQYWQNINTIRVAGGGNTNYAMVKDDIGNWYVKNYSADPEEIINAARSLALFGLGPALNAPGLLAASAEQKLAVQVQTDKIDPGEAARKLKEVKEATADTGATGAGGTGTAAAPPPLATPTGPVLGRQLFAAQATYNDATAKDLADVQADALKLKDLVAEAWKADKAVNEYAFKGDLDTFLNDAAALHLDKVKDVKPADGTVRDADALLTGLRLTKQFHGELAGKLRGYPEKAKADAEAAVKDAEGKLPEAKKLLDAAKERDQAKDDIEKNDAAAKTVRAKLNSPPAAPADKEKLDKELAALELERGKLVEKLEAAVKVAGDKTVADLEAPVTELEKTIKDQKNKSANAGPAAGAARDRMTKVVRETITETITRREQVLGRYETELDLIGRTVAAP